MGETSDQKVESLIFQLKEEFNFDDFNASLQIIDIPSIFLYCY